MHASCLAIRCCAPQQLPTAYKQQLHAVADATARRRLLAAQAVVSAKPSAQGRLRNCPLCVSKYPPHAPCSPSCFLREYAKASSLPYSILEIQSSRLHITVRCLRVRKPIECSLKCVYKASVCTEVITLVCVEYVVCVVCTCARLRHVTIQYAALFMCIC